MIEDFKVNAKWGKFKRVGKKQHLTRSYSVWNGLVNRCKPGGRFQTKYPTYIGCYMSTTFSSYQIFADWYTSQIGYGVEGYELDKDILVPENKLYSEETCVLVPSKLNSFYLSKAVDKELPYGVHSVKSGKFKASISLDNVPTHLGYFATAGEASDAYKAAKLTEARRWAERLRAGEFVVDRRVIEAMDNFKIER